MYEILCNGEYTVNKCKYVGVDEAVLRYLHI